MWHMRISIRGSATVKRPEAFTDGRARGGNRTDGAIASPTRPIAAYGAVVRSFRRSPGAMIGSLLLLLIMATALGGTWIAPQSPSAVQVEDRLLPPPTRKQGVRHWFGTDPLRADSRSPL